jgi:integrase
MATFRMKFVQAYADRHGKMRYYYRRPGFPRVALTGEPGSTAFAKAYEAASGQAPRRIGAERIVQGTFAALIVDYYETEAFTKLGAISRKTRRNVLERFRETFGTMAVRDMTPAKLDEVLEGTTNLKGVRDALRLLFKLAFRRGLIAVSPMDGLRLPKKAKTGFRPWTEADIALYCEKWPTGSRERLALALLLYTAQRRDDARAMGRQHLQDGGLRVRQHKTGAELLIPIHPDLQAELDQIPRTQLSFLQTQYGQPFSAAGFGQWFGEKAQEAGCPKGCTAHGLRKAACRRLAEAGCTERQIMAISGHQNPAEVSTYVKGADQIRLAREAMDKVESGTKPSNPGEPVRQSGRNVQ